MRANLAQSAGEIGEITKMMEAMYEHFSTEHGMKLGSPARLLAAALREGAGPSGGLCNAHFNTLLNMVTHGQART